MHLIKNKKSPSHPKKKKKKCPSNRTQAKSPFSIKKKSTYTKRSRFLINQKVYLTQKTNSISPKSIYPNAKSISQKKCLHHPKD